MDKRINRIDNQRIRTIDYFVVFLLLCISGNPLVGSFTEYIYIFTAVLLIVLAANYKTPLMTKKFLLVGGSLITLYVLQFVFVGNVSPAADINHFAKIYCGFIAVTIADSKFRLAYLKVMTYIAFASLVGVLFNLTIGQFPGFVVDRNVSVLIYNYHPSSFNSMEGLFRNCGMFWEPGAFQGYIILAFLMFMDDFKAFYNKHTKSFWILAVALVSTYSTTGYVVFALYLFLVFSENIKKSPLALIMTVLLVLVAVWAFLKFDFLGEKMMNEYESAQEVGEGDVSWTRMGSAVIAWQNVLRHPLIGNGFLMTALYGNLAEYMEGMGNGFFGAMNQLGIPFILLYLFLLFKNVTANNTLYRCGFVLLVVLMINGEFFLNYPMFWSLMFIKYPSENMPSSKSELKLKRSYYTT